MKYDGIVERLRTCDGELPDLLNEAADCIEWYQEWLSELRENSQETRENRQV